MALITVFFISQVRCSGEQSGCKRCRSVGVECRYPPREPRQRASTQGSSDRNTTGNTTDKSQQPPQRDPTSTAREQQQKTLQVPLPQYGASSKESGVLLTPVSPQIMEQVMDSEYSNQIQSVGDFDMDLASRFGDEQSVKGIGLDEWLEANCISDHTSLPSGMGSTDNLNLACFDAAMIDPGLMDDIDSMERAASLRNFDPTLSGCATPGLEFDQSPEDLPMSEAAGGGGGGSLYPPPESGLRRNERSRSSSTSNHRRPDRSPVSFASSSGSRSSTASSSSCSCLQLAACLVEDLAAKAATNNRASLDILLHDFRSALTQCTTILDCKRCVTARENNMLLAMAAKYMSTICECLAVCHAEMTRQTLGQDEEEGKGSNLNGRPHAEEMRFSTYLVQDSRERMQVLASLVNIQVGNFAEMIARLKTRPGVRRGHLLLLNEAGNKVNNLRVMLQHGGGSGGGGGGGNSLFGGGGMHSFY
ncbi:hypothetical protein QBC43DRAFT_270518 [Cladorrhinum sp. PSN259]|nr:hypothetical protein QBC43DRAFT_270518 [Cladorrhinum sp. PSN259]